MAQRGDDMSLGILLGGVIVLVAMSLMGMVDMDDSKTNEKEPVCTIQNE